MLLLVLKAPPVLYNNLSHSWANLVNTVRVDWNCSLIDEFRLSLLLEDWLEHPRLVSSMKDSPRCAMVIDLSADVWSILGVDGFILVAMTMKQRSHRNGPNVAPCPGPNSKFKTSLV